MQAQKQVSPEGLAWFQDARFGMFIHWGLYALLARGEWVMHIEGIAPPEYARLAEQFNPTAFDARAWAKLAADAGQRYMVITSRHHDGFSMYDTALSDYKITNTPFGRDPIRELADACAEQGVKLGFYVSLLDWRHPAYRFREATGQTWDDYLAFLHGQVRELCTNYGEVACIWFDGDWPHHDFNDTNQYFLPGGSFEYGQLYDMIHTLQPNAVVINNRHEVPLPGEDIQGFEQDLPGQNTAGFNVTKPAAGMPLEVCMTINKNWGYHSTDAGLKPARQLVATLARAASAGANLLLNVGPTPQGEIVPEHAAELRSVGAWLARNGRAIYGTSAGIIAPSADAVSTRKGDTQYVVVLNDADSVTLHDAPPELTHAVLLPDNTPAELARDGGTLTITLPREGRDPLATVVVLSATAAGAP